MKYLILFVCLIAPTQTFAGDLLSSTGLASTSLDFVWKVKIKESNWSGQLDCQSFFHYFKLTDGKKEINQYLDAQECDDWHDVLAKGTVLNPLCLDVGTDVGIKQAKCLAPSKIQ